MPYSQTVGKTEIWRARPRSSVSPSSLDQWPHARHIVDLVDEDNRGLHFTREREHGGDHFVADAVLLLREGRDMQAQESGAAVTRQGFDQHGLAAAGRSVEQDAQERGEEQGNGGYRWERLIE